jgi:FAD/FMN-containing dehydrogenase/Fe-S oxidoreductase
MSTALVQLRTKVPPIHIEGRLQEAEPAALTIDAAALAEDLRRSVRGEVRFGGGDRGMYASDAGNYRMVPLGVVLPRDSEDVLHTLAACRRYGAPLVARGGGTGIPGQTVNAAVVLDFSKYMNKILQLDVASSTALVQPGVVLDVLRDASKPHGLTFGPDPATHSRCTLGGMIGNNSCGIHSVMAGETVDNIDELEVATYDGERFTVGATSADELAQIIAAGGRRGEIYRRMQELDERHGERIRKEFPQIPRRVSGFNLPALLPENGFHVARALVGSECTCVVVLSARARLVKNPAVRSLLLLGYPDIFTAADHVVEPIQYKPIALEALDDTLLMDMRKKGLAPKNKNLLPEGKAWLLVEFGGDDKAAADAGARRLMEDYKNRGNPPSMKLFDNPDEEREVWDLREAGLGATARVPGEPDNHEGWEDSSVPPEHLGAYLRALKQLMDKYGYQGALYGHFGQGCVHTRLSFDLKTAEGIRRFRAFVGEAADLVIKEGGSLSGEHGDGQARGELLARMYSPELIGAFAEFKSIRDPEWKMNPGKVIAPFRMDENLRLGTHFNLPTLPTHFRFPTDHYSFSEATERCVGAGVCRRIHSGTMCPSYMVTREEMHSTRGRARMLNEMVRGETIKDGWRSKEVKEALDLCLSCKGCRGECPVQVDMASYKSEFLSHYYHARLRPRHAYASGLIFYWARIASHMPRVANFFASAPGLSHVFKFIAGYSQKRQIPQFARQSFKQWFAHRGPVNAGGPPVILWPDTFNNYFTPEVAQAAVQVLEHAGFAVRVPPQSLCCGRPLYDYGMLGLAKRKLLQVLSALRVPIEEGIPVVGLEPSCVAVFRDELGNLFAGDDDARRLSAQTLTLAEFLRDKVPGYRPPHLSRQAVVHGHCHHKALLHFEKESELLADMGLSCNVLDSGCCGMAGAFGYEKEHYEIGRQCGERVLLPAVRAAAAETLIIGDGFSCREQIRQETGRHALHLAQVLAMAQESSRP